MIPILEPLTHNELTIKNCSSFAKRIKNYDSSLYMVNLDDGSFITEIPLNVTINNCVKDLHIKTSIMENSSKETFSNF